MDYDVGAVFERNMLAMLGDYSDAHVGMTGFDPFAKGIGIRKGRVRCDKHQVKFRAVQHRESFTGLHRSHGIAVAFEQHLAVRIVVSCHQKDVLLLVRHAAKECKMLAKGVYP